MKKKGLSVKPVSHYRGRLSSEDWREKPLRGSKLRRPATEHRPLAFCMAFKVVSHLEDEGELVSSALLL